MNDTSAMLEKESQIGAIHVLGEAICKLCGGMDPFNNNSLLQSFLDDQSLQSYSVFLALWDICLLNKIVKALTIHNRKSFWSCCQILFGFFPTIARIANEASEKETNRRSCKGMLLIVILVSL